MGRKLDMIQKLEDCRVALEKAGFTFRHRIGVDASAKLPQLVLLDVKNRKGVCAALHPANYIQKRLEKLIHSCGLSWEWRGSESINVYDASLDWSGFDEVL